MAYIQRDIKFKRLAAYLTAYSISVILGGIALVFFYNSWNSTAGHLIIYSLRIGFRFSNQLFENFQSTEMIYRPCIFYYFWKRIYMLFWIHQMSHSIYYREQFYGNTSKAFLLNSNLVNMVVRIKSLF